MRLCSSSQLHRCPINFVHTVVLQKRFNTSTISEHIHVVTLQDAKSKLSFREVDKQRVYLAWQPIFTGKKALLRKPKKLRKEIIKRPSILKSLTPDLNVDKVVDILRVLLEKGVFESEDDAKAEFPELFQTTPGQEISHEAIEVDAAKSTTEAIEEAASEEHTEAESDGEDEFPEAEARAEEALPQHTVVLPSLYPICIPYKAQHLIVNETQRILEESCFEFVQKWLPNVLLNREWDSASSVELTTWTRLLDQKAAKLRSREAFNLEGTSLAEVLSAANQLRHSAVHRLPMTARGMQELVRSGVKLAFMLGDHKRASQLEDICYELEGQIKAMDLNKNALENSARAGLEEIKRQREELDQKERDMINSMVRHDQETKVLTGTLIQDSVSKILTSEGETEVEDESRDEDELPNENGRCNLL
ncbi:hypothetical protein F4804DRAFT_321253 [Jackrogersella minutella]|nr:hypothetical protein F4804DRAFT_321253 [Jackrogersella minutella]